MTNATKKFLTLTFALLFLAGGAYGQVKPDSIRRSAWQAFQAENGAGWTIHWNEETGTPATIVSGVTRPYAGPPAEAARAFLEAHRRLFAMEPGVPNLHLVGTRQVRKVSHVRFRQTYEGLPVYEAQYLVHLQQDGRVIMANGTYYPEIKAPTTPTLSAAAAQRIALGDLKGTPKPQEITRELMIYPDDGQFHLAWRLVVPTAPFGGWVYFIDARDGTILEKQSQLVDVVGDGKVYPKHPDNSSVTVKNLPRLNGTGRLRGTYVRVVNDEGGEAYRANHSFRYSPSNTHFDEVNLYYHVDRFRSQFINDLVDGSHSLGFTQITAHAHSTHPNPNIGDVNAWFDRDNQEIYFGDAESSPFINDFAKEDKVIYHEYSHAVIYDINTGIVSNCEEEGAISEGVPDYFAGTYTGRSVSGEYVGIVRDMANPGFNSYSDYQAADGNYSGPPCFGSGVEPHDGGEFFSAVLWDLRNASGITKGEADWLVYAALFYVDASPSFYEFRAGVIAEDDVEYSGQHRCTIKNTFAARGIGDGFKVTLSGDTYLIDGDFGNWTATSECPLGSVSYQWFLKKDGSGTWSNLNETSRFLSLRLHESAMLRVEATSSGKAVSDELQVEVCHSEPGDPPCPIPPRSLTQQGEEGTAAEKALRVQPLPEAFALQGNAPNPFNQRTQIRFALPEAARVQLVVYDVMGREVMRLLDEELPAGYHTTPMDASDLASGVYLYRMTAGDKFSGTGRMVVVK